MSTTIHHTHASHTGTKKEKLMNNAEISSKIIVGTISAMFGLALLKVGVKNVLEGGEAFTANLAEKVKGA